MKLLKKFSPSGEIKGLHVCANSGLLNSALGDAAGRISAANWPNDCVVQPRPANHRKIVHAMQGSKKINDLTCQQNLAAAKIYIRAPRAQLFDVLLRLQLLLQDVPVTRTVPQADASCKHASFHENVPTCTLVTVSQAGKNPHKALRAKVPTQLYIYSIYTWNMKTAEVSLETASASYNYNRIIPA